MAMVAGALVVSGANVANATELPDPFSAVARATPVGVANAADIRTDSHGENAVNATVAGTSVTMPVDPSDGITLGAADVPVSVHLPFAHGADDATTPGPGILSYDNNNGSVTIPIVQRDGSVQINTVIENASAPSRYSYQFGLPEGGALVAQTDGSVLAQDAAGAPLALIAAPWAKDSAGTPVSTRYEIVGTTLTQVVDFTAASSFPLVADPKLTLQAAGPYGPGFYIGLTGLEMKTVVNAILAAGGIAAVAVCSGSTKLPSPVARLAAFLCTAVGAPTIGAVLNAMNSVANSRTTKSTTCYQTLISGSRPFVATARGNCS
jgi:hypothetical protein